MASIVRSRPGRIAAARICRSLGTAPPWSCARKALGMVSVLPAMAGEAPRLSSCRPAFGMPCSAVANCAFLGRLIQGPRHSVSRSCPTFQHGSELRSLVEWRSSMTVGVRSPGRRSPGPWTRSPTSSSVLLAGRPRLDQSPPAVDPPDPRRPQPGPADRQPRRDRPGAARGRRRPARQGERCRTRLPDVPHPRHDQRLRVRAQRTDGRRGRY